MSKNYSGGIGILGIMGTVFVVLKLTEVIDWSWWWVTAPFWGPPAVIIPACGIGLGVVWVIQKIRG